MAKNLKYKVLWVDDEFETLEGIDESAYKRGIELIGVSNAKDALEELETPERFDAVLLDGLFLNDKDDKSTTSGNTPFGKVAKRLVELKAKRIILPWFILSGQKRFTKDDNEVLELFLDKDYADGKVFDKLVPDDVESLWNGIKDAVNEMPDFKLKQKYKDVLACADTDFLGKTVYERLFLLVKTLEQEDKIELGQDSLTEIRKVIESLFESLVEKNIIPFDIWRNHGHINGCSLFLSSKHDDYHFRKKVVPSLVSINLYQLLSKTQDASHSNGDLRLKVDTYLNSTNNDYFYKSCIFSLFDLLLWFKEFHKNFSSDQLLFSKK